MATWGVISAATAFVHTPMSFYVLRFLLGLAEAGFAPGMIFYLSLWFPQRVWARYAAVYLLAIPLTNVIGAPISSLILGTDGILGLHGWQWLFILEALPALVLAVAVFLFLPDGPADARFLTKREREIVASELAAGRDAVEERIHGVWSALADLRVILLCVVYFGIVVGLYGIGYWLPQMVQAMGYSNFAIGLLVALPLRRRGARAISLGPPQRQVPRARVARHASLADECRRLCAICRVELPHVDPDRACLRRHRHLLDAGAVLGHAAAISFGQRRRRAESPPSMRSAISAASSAPMRWAGPNRKPAIMRAAWRFSPCRCSPLPRWCWRWAGSGGPR